MLDSLFTFRGRLTRRQYFAASVLIHLVLGCIIVLGFWIMKPAPGSRQGIGAGAVLLILAIPALLSLWMSFSTQAARIRDIGWDPRIVMTASLAIGIIAYLVVLLMPEGATTELISKLVKAVNIAYGLGLLLTPSDYHVPADPTFDAPPAPLRSDRIEASPAPRLPSRNAATFGRRGL
ncbi:DUF805 domain-containing protein [Rhizobium sp. Pop5]|uniref:DUF805 domain-containing protein n=1 Tax=Rhizobium sp. Pop5 TaxID=1223565 RepID=UPI00028398FC|nr:DUF805 domain-containing protein [Rhizobium sp. Pop5]EJZ17315.1 signal peptide protein [Rhizobium sp. Pop5]UVD55077.1 DUF805 domain-containing protein [Rhizobium sp. Pop5]